MKYCHNINLRQYYIVIFETAKELLKDDYYFGFGGVVTFKNARKSVEAVKEIPMEKILLETDCPYLSPVPFRGTRCDSSLIHYTALTISEIKGINYDDVLRITTENAKRFYNIK